MGVPVWVTASHLGSVPYGIYFEKQIRANDAINYTFISGNFPSGISLSINGKLSGNPTINDPNSENPVYTYTFVLRATSSTNQSVDRTFTLSVTFGSVFVPTTVDQTGVRYTANYYQYQIFRGTVNTATGIFWRLESGQLPPSVNLSGNGMISGFMTGVSTTAIPLARESFLNPQQLIQTGSLSQTAWDNWLRSYLGQGQEYDYQFSVVLSNGMDAAELSLTVRIIYTKIPQDSSWFQVNQIPFDPDQYYFFVAVSDDDYIIWDSQPNLGSINNGAVSDLSVAAHSYSGKPVQYIMKPAYFSRLPQQLSLLNNGLMIGRVSFKTYQDDPNLIPLNDNYSFTVRAYTSDNFTYGERTFNLHVNRLHNAPYDNLWVRALAPVQERLDFKDIINDPILVPNEVIYRYNDPWFGRSRHLRFLFGPGLQPDNTGKYSQALENNHYNKTITFGEVRTAVAYDTNLKIKYEVVYLPVIDPLTGSDPVTGNPAGLPNIIDLREQITNYYLDGDQAYYVFRPNGLENMRQQLNQVIGFYSQGVLPDWMTSPQPIPGEIGKFYQPTGFIPAVVLAYTKPGGSDLIAFRLKNAGINFNDFQFEFDRYEFDSAMADEWSDNLGPAVQTVFDNDTTIFENKGTRFIEGAGGHLEEGGELSGDKYLKFPKLGVFL